MRLAGEAAQEGLDELSEAFSALPGRLPLLDGMSRRGNGTQSIEHFLAGRALTMRNWPFARLRPGEGGLEKAGSGRGPEYGVTVLPGDEDGDGPGHGVLGGRNLAVVADSRTGCRRAP